ncbi:MAG: type II toxin-antitoxin system RelE/ParE family toxin [Patescibacteria group bacterium]
MPAKHLIVDKSLRRQLLKIPLPIHQRIIKALNSIKVNPVSGIKLHGELKNYYKFRVGDYRIVYKFNPQESLVQIVKIEHRQGVYK